MSPRTNQNLWVAAKATLKREIYNCKRLSWERTQINRLTFYLKILEKESKVNLKQAERNNKIREEINETDKIEKDQ